MAAMGPSSSTLRLSSLKRRWHFFNLRLVATLTVGLEDGPDLLVVADLGLGRGGLGVGGRRAGWRQRPEGGEYGGDGQKGAGPQEHTAEPHGGPGRTWAGTSQAGRRTARAGPAAGGR